MKRSVCHFRFIVLALLSLLSAVLQAQVSVTTYHNDNVRSGENTQETILTPANVNSSGFGKLFSVTVDGYVYAQPLYMSNVQNIGGGTHNVVYVATEHDSVYAIDADNGAVLWQTSFINPGQGITSLSSSSDTSCTDLVPEVGITSTPVIDPTTGTIYVLARTKEIGSYVQRLHALDIATNAEKFGGPVVISATYQGRTFDPLRENQRSALLLENGHVIIAWAGLCDHPPYQGWIISYNAVTLAKEAVFNTEPAVVDNFGGGGVWMGGDGIAVDANGNLFFATGNGDYNSSVNNYGDSILRLSGPSGGQFSIIDGFTPFNQSSLSSSDTELSSGGVILLPDLPTGSPHQQLLAQVGKEGRIYLIDRNNMGEFCSLCISQDTQIVQEIPGAISNGLYGSPAFWNSTVYWGNDATGLTAWSFDANNTGLLSDSPISQSPQSLIDAAPVISANGNSNGILWVIDNTTYLSSCCQALYAFDATNLSHPLYDSNQAGSRDVPGGAVKFTAPLVANGKVYVGSQGSVTAYGLLSIPQAATPTFSPTPGSYSNPVTVTISDSTAGATIHCTTDGSTPLDSSPACSSININSTTLLQSIAVASGYSDSAVARGTYTISSSNPAPTIIATPASASVKIGSSAAYTISVTPQNGGNGAVSLTCTLPSTGELGCSMSPNSITPGTTSTLTVTTTAPTTALVAPAREKLSPIYALCLSLPAFALAGIGIESRRRRLGIRIARFLIVIATLFFASCGGGNPSSSESNRTRGNPGTPAGTYTITVTGTSGSLTGSTNVTLTVQ